MNFLPLASIPQSLGGTLLHRHIDWLRTCFERLGAVVPNEDYFNPMKALLSPTHYLSTGALAARRRVSFHQLTQQQNNLVHHFPHQKLSNGSISSLVNRTKSIDQVKRGILRVTPHDRICETLPISISPFLSLIEPLTWTYNRLLHPDASNNSNNNGNRLSLSDNEDDPGNNASASLLPTASPTRISVAQFVAEFQRKFPLAFEREFETTIRQVSGTNGASATRFANRANWPKNRYVDVPCLDHSAVPLPNDGYIHANFVDGYHRKKAYILTQGK